MKFSADGKNQTDANKKGKKLSLADYKKRQMEERKRQEEEHAREEAERQRQQNNRLSTDAVTAVLSSAVEAATNGSRVQTVTSSDVAWLSSLVGINLTGSPTAIGESSQELTKATSERLSDLAQATEQVNIFDLYPIDADLRRLDGFFFNSGPYMQKP